ncbi:MAG: hypothetical protein WD025_03125, partial [Bacteriovoracaceae bacterium]
MKSLGLFLIFACSAAFVRPVFGADLCHFLFRKNVRNTYSVDLDKIERVNRLEEWSQRLRTVAYKEDPLAPTAYRKALKRFEEVEQRLLAGDGDSAIFAYKTLFRRVEGAALAIERHSALANAIRKAQGKNVKDYTEFFRREGVLKVLASDYGARINNVQDLGAELEKLEKILRKRYRELGKNFDEYNHVRVHLQKLEKSESCSGSCAQAMERFFKNVGLRSDSERALFGPLVGNKKAMSLKETRAAFNSHPEAVLIARKKEFIQEGMQVVKKYIQKFRLFHKMMNSIANSSLGKTRRVTRIFKSIFDKQYKDFHAVAVKRVAYSALGPSKKFALMQEQLKAIDPDFFWMNFSRANEGQLQKTWKEMMEIARKEQPRDYERMLRAERLGKDLGPVSDQKLKGVFAFFASVGVAGAGWAYFNFEAEDQTPQSLDDEEPPALDDEEPDVLIDYLERVDTEITDS